MLLAYHFGRPHVDEFLAELTPAEWWEWKAAIDLGILPDPWRQTGQTIAAIVNWMQSLAPGEFERTTYQPEHYIPGLRGKTPEQLGRPTRAEANQAAYERAKARARERGGS